MALWFCVTQTPLRITENNKGDSQRVHLCIIIVFINADFLGNFVPTFFFMNAITTREFSLPPQGETFSTLQQKMPHTVGGIPT